MDASHTDLSADWRRCAPWLRAALTEAGDTHTLDDVQQGILDGRMHFWPGSKCAVVTEFYEYPQLKALNFWLVGGDLQEFLAMQPLIEMWAKAHGCSRALCGVTRRGWERVLGRQGAKAGWTIYMKELAA